MGRQAPHMRSAIRLGQEFLEGFQRKPLMSTITTDPKVLAARFNQAFNTHDEKSLGSVIAPNATFTAPGDVRIAGKEAVLAYTSGWLKAFPDAKINVTH